MGQKKNENTLLRNTMTVRQNADSKKRGGLWGLSQGAEVKRSGKVYTPMILQNESSKPLTKGSGIIFYFLFKNFGRIATVLINECD